MKFCHIAPIEYINKLTLDNQLVLAHLVEKSDSYVRAVCKGRPRENTLTILDNSAYELYMEGLPMFDGAKLIELAHMVNPDYIVMPDYPGEPSSVTISAATIFGKQFKDAGYGTFFVPQSISEDTEDYIAGFAWAASSPLVDYIGMSIIGVPGAFTGRGQLKDYLSRFKMMSILRERGLLSLARMNNKKIHFLGMIDGPNEIELCSQFEIDSWDSSTAVWHGINGITFDDSPTGLIDGKIKTMVDFNIKAESEFEEAAIKYNMDYVNDLVSKYNEVVLCEI